VEFRPNCGENFPDTFFLLQVPYIHRGESRRRINGTASLKGRAVKCGDCSVPLDSPNVPKSTSRRFGHFKHLLRSCFEVDKKKDSLRESNKCVLCGFYTNMFSSAHDAKTNASRVVNGLEICRTKSDATAGLQTTR